MIVKAAAVISDDLHLFNLHFALVNPTLSDSTWADRVGFNSTGPTAFEHELWSRPIGDIENVINDLGWSLRMNNA